MNIMQHLPEAVEALKTVQRQSNGFDNFKARLWLSIAIVAGGNDTLITMRDLVTLSKLTRFLPLANMIVDIAKGTPMDEQALNNVVEATLKYKERVYWERVSTEAFDWAKTLVELRKGV